MRGGAGCRGVRRVVVISLVVASLCWCVDTSAVHARVRPGPGGGAAIDLPDGLPALSSADDQCSALTAAPIAHTFLVPNRLDIAVQGAMVRFGARDGTVRGPAHPEANLWGGMLTATYAFTDRWFVTGIGAFGQGSSGSLAARLMSGVVGGGGRILGTNDDWYALSTAVVLMVTNSRVELGQGPFDIAVTAFGAGAALQAEIRPVKWVAAVPYVSVVRLLGVTLARGGLPPGPEIDLNRTWAMPGLDLWIYPDPNDRISHISLAGSTSFGQENRTRVVTLGYTLSLGGTGDSP